MVKIGNLIFGALLLITIVVIILIFIVPQYTGTGTGTKTTTATTSTRTSTTTTTRTGTSAVTTTSTGTSTQQNTGTTSTGTGTGTSTAIITDTILTFTPTSGPIGTVITIGRTTGTFATTTQTIGVGNGAGLYLKSTASNLTAMVMPGATTGQVTVTASGVTSTAPYNFQVTATVVPSNTWSSQQPVAIGREGYPARLGTAVDISATGDTVIAGGPRDGRLVDPQPHHPNLGAAWIFVKTANVWTQQGSKLVGDGYIQNMGSVEQGSAVAVSADGDTVLIGAPYDNTQGVSGQVLYGVGAAWVFVRTNGVWSQQGSKFLPTGGVGLSMFGSSVSLSADGNTALIGGPNDDSNKGASWIFTRSNAGVWDPIGVKLVGGSALGANVYQGSSVAMSADGNTALIGAYNENFGGGGGWIFVRSNGGSWVQQQKLPAVYDNTGLSNVGTSATLNADGSIALLGGVGDSTFKGAAWAFKRNGSTWTQEGGKLLGTVQDYARFGSSVSLTADGSVALIGEFNVDSRAGATWVFTRSAAGVWSKPSNSRLSGTASSEQGFSVALTKDGKTAAIGGPGDNLSQGQVMIIS